MAARNAARTPLNTTARETFSVTFSSARPNIAPRTKRVQARFLLWTLALLAGAALHSQARLQKPNCSAIGTTGIKAAIEIIPREASLPGVDCKSAINRLATNRVTANSQPLLIKPNFSKISFAECTSPNFRPNRPTSRTRTSEQLATIPEIWSESESGHESDSDSGPSLYPEAQALSPARHAPRESSLGERKVSESKEKPLLNAAAQAFDPKATLGSHLHDWDTGTLGLTKQTHESGLSRLARRQLARRLGGDARIDGLLASCDEDVWNELHAAPSALDPAAMMHADPGRDDTIDELMPTIDFPVAKAIGEWDKLHQATCDKCTPTCRSSKCYYNLFRHRLRCGYAPKLIKTPPKSRRKNYKHTYDSWGGTVRHLEKLDRQNILTDGQASLPPGASLLPLHAVIKSSDQRKFERTGLPIGGPKVRLCADATATGLNDCTAPWRFRYAGPEHILSLLGPTTTHMCALDLRTYFPNLPLTEEFSKTYMWISDPRYEFGRGQNKAQPKAKRNRHARFRRYRGGCFGLRTMSAWASVVSGEIVRILNVQLQSLPGTVASVYCDDIFICGPNYSTTLQASMMARNLINRLGLQTSAEKFQPPSQVCEYLGLIFDLKATPSVVRCKPDKLAEIQELLRESLEAGRIARADAKTLVGKLMWLSAVISHGRTFVQRILPASYYRKQFYNVTPGFRDDAEWWLSRLAATEHASRIIPIDHGRRVVSFKGDASGFGGYGYVYENALHYASFRPEHQTHANMLSKEMIAAASMVDTYGATLQNSFIKFGCDNAGTCFAINSQRTADPEGMILLRHMARACSRWGITIIGFHVTRTSNLLADRLTRFDTLDELQTELNLINLQLDHETPARLSNWRNPLHSTEPEHVLYVHRRSRMG